MLWLAVVALFSTQGFSANRTGGFLVLVLSWMHIKLSGPMIVLLHHLIRKGAHFVAYAVLSAIFFRAFRGPVPPVMWRLSWPLLSLAVCLVTASADELHQLYTPGRGGSYRDVMLDMAGALFAQLVILMVYLGKPGKRPNGSR